MDAMAKNILFFTLCVLLLIVLVIINFHKKEAIEVVHSDIPLVMKVSPKG